MDYNFEVFIQFPCYEKNGCIVIDDKKYDFPQTPPPWEFIFKERDMSLILFDMDEEEEGFPLLINGVRYDELLESLVRREPIARAKTSINM